MTPHPLVQEAVRKLCRRFDAGGYGLAPVIDIGALVANADGAVDAKEAEVLRYLYETLLGSRFPPPVVHHLVRASLHVILEAGVAARAELLGEILADCDAVEHGLTVALGMAFASNGLSEAERKLIDTIATAGRWTPKRLDDLIARVRPDFEKA